MFLAAQWRTTHADHDENGTRIHLDDIKDVVSALFFMSAGDRDMIDG